MGNGRAVRQPPVFCSNLKRQVKKEYIHVSPCEGRIYIRQSRGDRGKSKQGYLGEFHFLHVSFKWGVQYDNK